MSSRNNIGSRRPRITKKEFAPWQNDAPVFSLDDEEDARLTGMLDGKMSLSTGTSSGMRRATAKIFTREGTKLVLADVAEPGGQEMLHMVKDLGRTGIVNVLKTKVTLNGCYAARGGVVISRQSWNRYPVVYSFS